MNISLKNNPKSNQSHFTIFIGDDTVEYDMDAEDQQWLEKCTKTRAADFEKVIEFLEKSSLHEIPSLYELQAHQLVDHIEAEKIFDYWLNKRLRTRQKMLFEIKRASDGQKKKKNFYRNPYVVFHQNIERMHTRKNRFKDNENYLEMLEHRKDLAQCRNFFKAIANQAKKKHEDMKTNLETFESIYQGQGLWNGFQGSDDSARREVEQPPPPGNPDPVIEVHYFTPRSGSKYFSPVINETGIGWASPKTEEHKTFCKLPGGLVRKRVGRGGRIVYDRQRHNTGTWNSEYKQVDINCYVKCKLIRGPFICSPSSTSNFVLTNSCIETEKCSPRERFQMK